MVALVAVALMVKSHSKPDWVYGQIYRVVNLHHVIVKEPEPNWTPLRPEDLRPRKHYDVTLPAQTTAWLVGQRYSVARLTRELGHTQVSAKGTLFTRDRFHAASFEVLAPQTVYGTDGSIAFFSFAFTSLADVFRNEQKGEAIQRRLAHRHDRGLL